MSSQLYYASKVQPIVQAEITKLSEKPSRGQHMAIVNCVLADVYKRQSAEVKQEVQAAREKRKANLEAQKCTNFGAMEPEKLAMWVDSLVAEFIANGIVIVKLGPWLTWSSSS